MYLAVALAAVVAGLPSLQGEFLSGDDIQLVRDHVLVNRPSLEHASELFRIVHRDLYQPVALLSFSLDFSVVKVLGLQSQLPGSPPGTWWFHLINVLLHAVSACLVFALILRVTDRRAVAATAALLFAVHPLSMEPVAWISGRMTLLATVFLLAAVMTMEDWRRDGRWWRIVLVFVFAALCMMSKVRISLPVLMLVPALYLRVRPALRWWIVWVGLAILTAGFVWLNYEASSSMIARGAEHLQGSRWARTVLALGWYLSRLIVPVGLSPHHPAPPTIGWLDREVLMAAAVVIVAAILAVVAARRTRVGWVGLLWFLAAIAVTLPLIPSRNAMVAERYAYLPNVGLFWIAATILVWLHGRVRSGFGAGAATAISVLIGISLGASLCTASWRVEQAYRSDLRRAGRIAELYPHIPGMSAQYAWELYSAERCTEAIEIAREAVRRHGDAVKSEALRVIGMCEARLGNVETALETLRRAIAADPDDGMGYDRLAQVLESAGRPAEAIDALERCAEILPNYNPALVRLASLYRETRRSAEARAVYEKILANNPHDVTASVALAEFEIGAGQYRRALDRLQTLLEAVPEHVPARINAGYCLAALGEPAAAIREYEAALSIDPDAKVAIVNLANLLTEAGDRGNAGRILEDYLQRHPADRWVLDLAIEQFVSDGAFRRAAAVLARAIEAAPRDPELRARYAWVSGRAGQWDIAQQFAEQALALDAGNNLAGIVMCVASLSRGEHEVAVHIAERLITSGVLLRPELFDALSRLMQTHMEATPEDPWSFYVLCMACAATGRDEVAKVMAEEFKLRTDDPELRERVDRLLPDAEQTPAAPATRPVPDSRGEQE